MLGRWWRAGGKVVGGAKRGEGLGFPTANIPLPQGTSLGHGIYAVRTTIEGKRYDGAAYLGTRPTYDDGMPVLEVFLFDFDDDLYGRDIDVEFIDFIRPDRRFDGIEALKVQMAKDCDKSREILTAVTADDPMAKHPLGR
jgi:riboflavin kinase/FMN adenylyltransferase